MKLKYLMPVAITILLHFVPVVSKAQFPGYPGEDPDGMDVPVDGGLSLLLAAGAGYATKKLAARKNNLKKPE